MLRKHLSLIIKDLRPAKCNLYLSFCSLRSKINFIFCLLSIFLFSFLFAYSNNPETIKSVSRNIFWKNHVPGFKYPVSGFYFEGAVFEDRSSLPLYSENFRLNNLDNVTITDTVFQVISTNEINNISDSSQLSSLGSQLSLKKSISIIKKIPYLTVSFLPVIRYRSSKDSGHFIYKRLISFRLNFNKDDSVNSLVNKQLKGNGNINNSEFKKNYAFHSVLSTGTWYKFAVTVTGMHKITFNDLLKYGINPGNINPQNIRIFGNGGGVLLENCTTFHYDDLVENPVQVFSSDGSPLISNKFSAGDYIIFYGRGPNVWSYDTVGKRFHHITNIYSDASYYFLNTDLAPGQRIQIEPSINTGANRYISTFVDYAFHEKDSINLLGSGRLWLGEVFNIQTTYNFSFSFPNLSADSPIYLKTSLIANSPNATYFDVTANDKSSTIGSFRVGPMINTPCLNCSYAVSSAKTFTFTPNINQQGININITYDQNASTDIGWLDYLELNVLRKLISSGSQMAFRSTESIGKGNISRFAISNPDHNLNLSVLDVTNPVQPLAVTLQITSANDTLAFTLPTDKLKEFIAFDPTPAAKLISPTFVGLVPNQDLHALAASAPDLIIVTYPDFMAQALRLADIHTKKDNMNVIVTTPALIYNEFSSGAQDISAIRNFAKMFFDVDTIKYSALPGQHSFRYMLFVGRASYDYKDRVSSNTNFVPIYESSNSLDPTSSFDTDDFFGIFHSDNNGNGSGSNGNLDIGIGRFPVTSVDQAKTAVDKIETYISDKNLAPSNIDPTTGRTQISNFADWKNIVGFIADIYTDGTLHEGQADELSSGLSESNPYINIDKIYLAAYSAFATPGGVRIPDATAAINKRVNNGALILNYTGHGGPLGLSNERVLELSDIAQWNNKYNLPVIMTATCEFSTLDNPGQFSAGEYAFFNASGGAIALFTTTRLSFSNSNYVLDQNFFDIAPNKFLPSPDSNIPTRMGDIVMLSKVKSGSGSDIRNFVLIGDPALQISYPKYNIITTSINSHDISNSQLSTPDTLKALSKVTIKGIISESNTGNWKLDSANQLKSFNGYLYTTIFDKPETIATLPNSLCSTVFEFSIQKSIMYKGTAKVTDGNFQFTFFVPKDIAYKYGVGKISYYAAGDTLPWSSLNSHLPNPNCLDAAGYYSNFIVGGTSDSIIPDPNAAPVISLYLDNTKFVSGAATSPNPLLLAYLSDPYGINTTGNSIGHDLTAVIDDNSENTIILNDYYHTDPDTYKKGTVQYNLSGLSIGHHTLSLRAWDVLDNSSEAAIDFNVEQSSKVYCYPNPFKVPNSSYIIFSFSHNYALDNVNTTMQLTISDINGRILLNSSIPTIDALNYADNTYTSSCYWYGVLNNFAYVHPGLYFYQLHVTNSSGLNFTGNGKLLILQSGN